MIKVIMLDLDGTVYCGNKLLPGADVAIQHMRNSGIKVLFCTNNSTLPPFEISKKLNKMGVSCEESEIISSGGLAARYAIDHHLKNVFFSGTEKMRCMLLDSGVDLVDENECNNLIIAFDMDFTYHKLTKAVRAALNSKSIIVCNQDKLFPLEDGIYPGSGAIVTPIIYCSGHKPDIFLGKPDTYMMDYVSKLFSVAPKEILVIGDTLENDVAMANSYGSFSLFITPNANERFAIRSLSETLTWDWSSAFIY